MYEILRSNPSNGSSCGYHKNHSKIQPSASAEHQQHRPHTLTAVPWFISPSWDSECIQQKPQSHDNTILCQVQCAFAVARPTVWNSLPDHLRDPAVDSWTIYVAPEDVFVRQTFDALAHQRCYVTALYKSTFTYILTCCCYCLSEKNSSTTKGSHRITFLAN